MYTNTYIHAGTVYVHTYIHTYIHTYTHQSTKNGGHLARLGDKRIVYRVLVERSEVKRQLGRSRRRWKDNIEIDFQEVGWGFGLD
jgi:hypothetical protein